MEEHRRRGAAWQLRGQWPPSSSDSVGFVSQKAAGAAVIFLRQWSVRHTEVGGADAC